MRRRRAAVLRLRRRGRRYCTRRPQRGIAAPREAGVQHAGWRYWDCSKWDCSKWDCSKWDCSKWDCSTRKAGLTDRVRHEQ